MRKVSSASWEVPQKHRPEKYVSSVTIQFLKPKNHLLDLKQQCFCVTKYADDSFMFVPKNEKKNTEIVLV